MSKRPKFTREGLEKLAAFEIDVDAVQEFRMHDANVGAESMRERAANLADRVCKRLAAAIRTLPLHEQPSQ